MVWKPLNSLTVASLLVVLCLGWSNTSWAQDEEYSEPDYYDFEQEDETEAVPADWEKRSPAHRAYVEKPVTIRPFNESQYRDLRRAVNAEFERAPEKLSPDEKRNYQKRQRRKQEQAAGKNRKRTRQNNPEYARPSIRLPSLGLGPAFQWMLITGFVALVAFLLLRLFGSAAFKSNKSVESTAFTVEDLEENILESDLERALRMALEAGEFRLAVRIWYLAILKELSLRNFIAWKRDKTNSHYLAEMRGNEGFQHFRSTTREYERVWYGDSTVDKAQYDQLAPIFEQYLKSVRK